MKKKLLVLSLIFFGLTIGQIQADTKALMPENAQVARVWHGKVENKRAAEYEKYITGQIPGFRKIPGNLGYSLLKEKVGTETHFMVISYWDKKESIEGYAGKDIHQVHALPRDPEYLIAPEPTVMNYEIAVKNFK